MVIENGGNWFGDLLTTAMFLNNQRGGLA